jgi:parallel beta-helix repeat protein
LYTLTGDIYNTTLEIQKTGAVLDGAGFTMSGNTSGVGLIVNGTSNIALKNLTLTSFRIGIQVEQSSDDVILANTITNCEDGLLLNYANNIQITNNKITANSQTAIVLYSFSCDNQIVNNLIDSNGNGFWCEFPGTFNGTNDGTKIVGNNITNNVGIAVLIRGSANNLIQGNNITGNQYGIGISGSSCNYNTISQIIW